MNLRSDQKWMKRTLLMKDGVKGSNLYKYSSENDPWLILEELIQTLDFKPVSGASDLWWTSYENPPSSMLLRLLNSLSFSFDSVSKHLSLRFETEVADDGDGCVCHADFNSSWWEISLFTVKRCFYRTLAPPGLDPRQNQLMCFLACGLKTWL